MRIALRSSTDDAAAAAASRPRSRRPLTALIPATRATGANISAAANTLATVSDVATDPAGNVYAVGFIRGTTVGATGESVLAKFSPSGQELFVRRGPASPVFGRLAIGVDGAIYAAGSAGGDVLVARLSSDGSTVWNHPSYRQRVRAVR
jgi:hypothetical protein